MARFTPLLWLALLGLLCSGASAQIAELFSPPVAPRPSAPPGVSASPASPGASSSAPSPMTPPGPPSFPTKMAPYTYTWIFALAMIFAFMDGYSIGANDVANSFATSVGSRSLKLWQAVVIACFTEFGGAMLLGAETTSTIKDSIIDTDLFEGRPDLLMTAFFCALVSSSSWVMYATYLGWPVSTTHTIVGSLIGVGISGFGVDAVRWGWDGKGVAQIVASWFLSPLLAGIIAAVVYLITKYAIMRSEHSLRRGLWAIPFYFTITGFIVSFYLVTKNGKTTLTIKPGKSGGLEMTGNIPLAFGIIGAVTAVIGIFCVAFLVPFFHRMLVKEEDIPLWKVLIIWCLPEQPHDDKVDLKLKQLFTPEELTQEEKHELGWVLEEDVKKIEDEAKEAPTKNPFVRLYRHIKVLLWRSLFLDVASVQHDSSAKGAHDAAVKYDNKTEYLYSMLQVVTAAFASFAHGSNDVSNALGPLAGVYQIWTTGDFNAGGKASVPLWMLAYVAFALDCGLALYGYNVMRSLGNNITYHSPSRGFCMELGAALAVITASFMALPVSTTQCIVGATVAVGLCNGSVKSINWIMVLICFCGWFLTLPLAGTFSGCLYALLTRGPSFTLPNGA